MGHVDTLEIAVAERDEILRSMDIERAKAFITRHGGKVPRKTMDWEKVLHLARWEVTTMPDNLKHESRVYLAMHGAQQISTLPETSPYLIAAIDLIFPKNLTDAIITESGNG